MAVRRSRLPLLLEEPMKLYRRTAFLTAAAAATVLISAACGGDGRAPATAPTATAAPVPSPTAMMEKKDDAAMMAKTPEAMMDKGEAKSFSVHALNSSGQTGSVTLKADGDKTVVMIAVTPGAAGVPQPAHIHSGTCEVTAGIDFGLENVMDGKSTTTVSAKLADIVSKDRVVIVHKSGPEAAVYTACGAVSGSGAMMMDADKMMDKSGDAMMSKTPAAMMDKSGDAMTGKVSEQRFAAHFVDSVPKHGETFAASPNHVVINFDFTLGNGSAIKVTRDGQAVTTPAATISGARKLTLETSLPAGSADGTYTVDYKACWPDGSCHDGQFGFIVDGKMAANYKDMTGKAAVSIDIANIAFGPQMVVVSAGTKVTWTNRDAVVHFVNSDPHPTHNHTPALNSLDLAKDASYSFTLAQAGEYAYHCSAHTNMTGRVLVKA